MVITQVSCQSIDYSRSYPSGIDQYANTGRSNRKPWVDMTRTTLSDGALDKYLNDLYFTPEGIKTAVSKAAAIDKYPNIKRVYQYSELY